jgi:Ricin-type beta-trefoil lectin domain-like
MKSGRWLSIEGSKDNWASDNATVTIRDGLADAPSPQIWTIIPYGTAWVLINAYSMKLLSIRDRSTDNNATVTQFHAQIGESGPIYQTWSFDQLNNDYFLIRNLHSNKFIGPHGRSTGQDAYCIQYENQSGKDSYQEWTFEAAPNVV